MKGGKVPVGFTLGMSSRYVFTEAALQQMADGLVGKPVVVDADGRTEGSIVEARVVDGEVRCTANVPEWMVDAVFGMDATARDVSVSGDERRVAGIDCVHGVRAHLPPRLRP